MKEPVKRKAESDAKGARNLPAALPESHRAIKSRTIERAPQGKTSAASREPAAVANHSFPIVGIGASAGGLEAFIQLLKHLPADTGMGFVLVQHLDPQHESALTQLLARASAMPVSEVTHNQRVEANHVYVIPPNTNLSMVAGVLKLEPRPKGRAPHRSIDFFFESLGQDQKEYAIGVILSGTATDGTLGLETIKAEAGITFAQDESAKYDSMPRSAIAAGCVDFVLPPEAIAAELARIAKHPYIANVPGKGPPELHSEAEREADQHEGPNAPLASGGRGTPRTGSRRAKAEAAAGTDHRGSAQESFKRILLLLRNHCGVDFSLYKSSTIQRRVTRRLVLNKHETLAEYAVFLKGNGKELDALYSDVLISVTSFFRNPEAFETLKRKIFPKLIAQRGREEMRIWVLGCSTGQEAYSLAMTFAESAAKKSRVPKLQIFATDLNESLLDKARHGLYAKSLAQDVSPERLRRFFVEEVGGYRVSKALREQVVFARQNVMSDPPFSRMDLITCRNLLIYLEPELQKKIFPAFHYALKPGGFLFLGSSESIGGFTELFAPVDKKHKIFSRKTAPTPAFRLPLPSERAVQPSPGPHAPGPAASEQALPEGMRGEFNAQREADRISVNQFAPPGVLINAGGQVLQFRGATGAYLEPPTGKASFDLLKMAREGLMLPLRAAINKAKRENKPVRREGIRVHEKGGARAATVQVIPLRNLKERCFLVLFEGAESRAAHAPPYSGGSVLAGIRKPPPRSRTLLRHEARRIAELERELAETRDYLQSVQEQNEAANEELQASSEEVQSANEELQSINEELETSKEELESTNEELSTINDEMVSRNSELSRVNADLSNLQVSIQTAILLLGPDLTIRRFTQPAEKIFNLLATDVGRSFGGVRHNLDLPELERLLAEVIDSVSLREREVQDKAGRWYELRARPYLTLDNKVAGVVLVLTDIDALKRSEQEIKSARDYAEATLRTAPVPFLVLRADLRVNTASEAFYNDFKVEPAATEGRLIYEIGNGQWNISKLRELLEEIIPQRNVFNGFEVTHKFANIGTRTMLLNARRVDNADGVPDRILLAIEDITERIEAQAVLRASEAQARELAERFRFLAESMPQKIFTAKPNGEIDYFNRQWTEFTGLTFEQIHAWGWLQFVHPADVQENVRGWQHSIDTREPFYMEHRFLRVDGAYRWHVTRAVPMLDAEGKVMMWIASNTDIEDLRQAKDRAEFASHAKDEFLAALSHELRTPLTPVLMSAAALQQDDRLPQDVREQLSMMERNIALEARLIDDLLDLTRITHGKLSLRTQPCDAHHLIGLAVEMVRSDAQGKRQTLEIDLAAEHSHVTGDPARLQQVFWNLLKNAVKFTPESGRLTVRSHDVADRLALEISDSGIGISADAIERIFLPFEQAAAASPDHRVGGLGLGLSIAKAILDLHGGSIQAESDGLGEGATFRVELPATEAPLDDAPGGDLHPFGAATSRSPSHRAVAAPLRLLLVEDHQSTLEVMERMLTGAGHRVTTAMSVASALRLAGAGRFDAVISDLGLPDGTGFELMEKLRATHGLRGIALSGYGMDEDLRRSSEAGFAAHLTKPIDFAQLERALEDLMADNSPIPR